MRKIKKFKIPLYHYDIYRKAKKIKLDIDNSHFKGQTGLKEFVSVLYSNMEPSTVFEYIKSDSPLWMRLNIENRQNAATVGAITFGKTFEEKINALSDELEKKVALLASHMFLISALNMLSELANEEAKLDGFIVSKPYILSVWEKENFINISQNESLLNLEPEFINEILIKINSEKIPINMNDKELSPKYSALYLIPWISKNRK
jgi:hypothetical protein